MPDAHVGKGATVGSVIATKGAIIPAAVGVDIGCGMNAVQLGIKAEHLPDDLTKLHSYIAKAVPSGVGKGHDVALTKSGAKAAWMDKANQPEEVLESNKLWSTATSQWGTLGSGNHFVEVCLDENDYVWIVLHSGSRGVGNKLAQKHIADAKAKMRRMFIDLEDPDLAYLIQGDADFNAYIRAMLWAQDYAASNRDIMMASVLDAFFRFMGATLGYACNEAINCHHNYTEMEHHHGHDLWVTRKGAIRAREGDRGIIPGSMATGTYIVEGLGNPASFNSASHGAGRRMSRGEAKRNVTVDELRDAMKGKAWNESSAQSLLDEAPAAYKPIEDVMEAQADLVRVTHKLTQVLNYKGSA